MINLRSTSVLFFFFAASFSANAQATFSAITALFQSHCATGCHNSTDNTGNLDLTGTDSEIYTRLVNVDPTNPAASAAGYKRIKPGHPDKSFLVRKCNNGLYPNDALPDLSYGNPMPSYPQQALADEEVELIRQWVYEGAPLTGNVVNTALINEFYQVGGISSVPVTPPLPTEEGAFQIHLGKLFLEPQTEVEYFLKYDLGLADNIYVDRIELIMANQSHHFILYKFLPGQDAGYEDGLRIQNPLNGSGSSGSSSTLVNAWQVSYNTELPQGTAYLWNAGDVLDMNYHIRNYNLDSILAVEAFINVYTRQDPEPPSIMYSDLITNWNIFIPNDNQPHVFTRAEYSNSETRFWNIWQLTSHTHKYGTDYDFFLRNPDGSQGEQIYEGWYNTDYTFNQGYYEYSHPPIRQFEPQLEINPRHGLIQQASYRNNGSGPVTFGLTTNDEMMVYYLQYTLGDLIDNPSGIESPGSSALRVFPNPSNGLVNIGFNAEKSGVAKLLVYDISGRMIESTQVVIQNGNQTIPLGKTLSPGSYLIDFEFDGKSYRQHVISN